MPIADADRDRVMALLIEVCRGDAGEYLAALIGLSTAGVMRLAELSGTPADELIESFCTAMRFTVHVMTPRPGRMN